jgi:hypothetical protein
MWFRNGLFAIAATAPMLMASAACASVVVTINDSTHATANVSLTDPSNVTYTATVRIAFDQAFNLSAESLNLSAELIDATNAPIGVVTDPNFPVIISVEPPKPPTDVIFTSGLEIGQPTDGSLAFFNSYELEIESFDLTCGSTTSPYRLYKAPHGSTVFADVTDDVFTGSVRARGRGGAFSQFIIVKDASASLVLALTKLTALTLRLATSAIPVGPLLTSLTTLLGKILTDLVPFPDLNAAITDLGTFISSITANAGTTINNEWIAGGSLVNDAGDLLSLAQTLNFTLVSLQGTPLCTLPPP